MTTAPSPAERLDRYLAWIQQQKRTLDHDMLTLQGSAITGLSREATSRIVTYLVGHNCLHQGNDLENMPRYSLDRPSLAAMSDTTRQELIRICSTDSNVLPAKPGTQAMVPHRGAPPGNTNALRHGRYSARMQQLLAAPPTYTLDKELATVEAITEDLLEQPNTPVELILKAITTLARLKVAAAALASHRPAPPPEPTPPVGALLAAPPDLPPPGNA